MRRGEERRLALGSCATGLVTAWYNATKGFGFVAIADGGKDVFVHASVLQRSGVPHLTEGQTVWVRVVQGAKGQEAVFVRLP